MKVAIYILLLVSALIISAAYFVNGKVVSTSAPLAVIPESPWVIEGESGTLGAELYASCASCHMADGSGRSDGDVPRLAGQSQKVLVHKLQKLRDGSSYLPVMLPFARALSADEVLEVSRYIAGLSTITAATLVQTVPAADSLAATKYQEYCSACHGAQGQGNDALLAPKLCGQHSAYLLRRMSETRQNLRGDADSGMAAILNIIEKDDQIEIAQWLEAIQCTATGLSAGSNT
tara:strand:- start:2420 stop:3118 length:699 start_codon:yes stop_codon:yes gene_type:complete